jgi:hypothetical protein
MLWFSSQPFLKATGDVVTLASMETQMCPVFVVSTDIKFETMSKSICGIPTDSDALLAWPVSLRRRFRGFGVGSESEKGLLDIDDDALAELDLSEGEVTWDDEVIATEDLGM